MFGGRSKKKIYLNIIQRYDIKNKKWEILPTKLNIPEKTSRLTSFIHPIRIRIEKENNYNRQLLYAHCIGGVREDVEKTWYTISWSHFMRPLDDLLPKKYLWDRPSKVFCFWLRECGFGKNTNLGQVLGEIVNHFAGSL